MDASSKPFCLSLKSLLYSWVVWYLSPRSIFPFSHLSSAMICPPHIAPHAHITSRTVLSCITTGYFYLSPCVDIYYLALFSFSLCLLSCFFHILYNCCSLYAYKHKTTYYKSTTMSDAHSPHLRRSSFFACCPVLFWLSFSLYL